MRNLPVTKRVLSAICTVLFLPLLLNICKPVPAHGALLAPEVEFLGSEKIKSSKETIGFVVKANPGTLDPAKTVILLDGAEVNSIWDQTTKVVRWTPSVPLQSRNYTATLKLTNTDGSVYGFDASFTILPGFEFTGSLPWPNPCRETTINFRYTMTSVPENIWIRIYDLSENLILKRELTPGDGIQEFAWDKCFESGEIVPYGSYYYVLEATNYDGTSTRTTGRFTLLPR
ncbi:MAG: hypothetical protein CVV64_01360 [Candidatus Wallbacteria bacterium HGW-Wallbacteria-1]|uniref:FlgD Ig-like domain-containing protein n=1 Tax=Candidatus Wallbacteria bacterium HGW-Wallbacteria-1 TaxID=2013854 RepID=A0A2N1PUS9_9BACT|nr:MAG: hypothetical protein CVV64_01360 [Candidatus Wallbacteria bacterium HGW-Wallbacteria-1]